MEKTQYMFQVGIVMDYPLNGKLKSNTKKTKKTKMKFQLLNLEKNVESLLKNGLKYTKHNLKD